MKKIIIIVALITLNSYSQTLPPPPGIDESEVSEVYKDTRYDYYPNLEAYYDYKSGVYLYKNMSKNTWIKTTVLPLTIRGYSLSNGKHFALDYKGEHPYEMLQEHKKQYPANYSSRRQKPKDDTKDIIIASK